MKLGLTVLAGLTAIALLLGAQAPADTLPLQPSFEQSDDTNIEGMAIEKILKKCKTCHGKDMAGKQKKKKMQNYQKPEQAL